MLRYTWRLQGWLAALVLLSVLSATDSFARRARPKPPPSPSETQNPKSKTPEPPPPAPEPPPPTPQIQRLVFSPYVYSYQADARRRIPVAGVRNPDGSSALAHHPWDGLGPWFSYDRAQWHKNQLQLLRANGVDVLLPVFRGDRAARATYAIKGLGCLAQALKELRQEREQPFMRGRDFPLVGMYFDTEAMRLQYGEAPDMRSEEVRRTFYGMVREFFLHIPPEFRAAVPLPPDRAREQRPLPGSQLAPGTAHVVFLSSPSPLRNLDAAALAACADRFAKEFGAPLLWLGDRGFAGKAAGLDGAAGATNSEGGWIHVGHLYPGRNTTAAALPAPVREASAGPPAGEQLAAAARQSTPVVESRRLGRTYIERWIERLREHPDWLLISSWNNAREGTDIAPAHEFGVQYLDLTRAGSGQFKGGVDYTVNFLRTTVPAVMAPRTLYQVEVQAQNTGRKGWGPGTGTGLSYRWYRDGRPVGDTAPIVTSLSTAPTDLRTFSLGIAGPMNGAQPLPNGDYELRLDMLRAPAEWFASPASLPYMIPVRIGDPGGTRAYWITSGMPALAKSGATYTVPIRLRNDGAAMWRKADGLAVGYRWLRASSDLHGVTTQKEERLEATGRLDLPADVPPGAVIVLQVPVRLADDAGKPLPVWSPKETWCYLLEWDLFDGKQWVSQAGMPTRREVVAVLADDLGPSFIGTGLATTQPSGGTARTKVGIRNNGPEPWSATTDRLVYHWYFFDGSEARWAGLETPLPHDVKPGETVVVPDVRIQVPDLTGPMYLTLDLKRGQNYASTGSNSRGGDLYVLPVNVVGGALQPVNLSPVFDTDGISLDTNRGDGDLDGKGHTLPGEELPPYLFRPPVGAAKLDTSVYPCGLWTHPVSGGDRIPFWYPEKRGDGGKNIVTCAGQRLEFPEGIRSAVHFLGMATEPGAAGDVTLIYRDGTTSVIPLEMSSWTEGAQHGEHVAFTCRHRHTPTADEPAVRAYLYHYTLRTQRGKTLVAVELPRNPAMKLVAVTLETDTRPEFQPRLRLPGVLAPP